MSSFTNHTAITPSTQWWLWENWEAYSYYTDLFGERITITVPKGYIFDGASVPRFLGFIIQKVEADTLPISGVHDYIFTNERWVGRIRADIIYIEGCIVYNIPKLLESKRYFFILIKILQYIAMGVALLLFSRIVWYKIPTILKKLLFL